MESQEARMGRLRLIGECDKGKGPAGFSAQVRNGSCTQVSMTHIYSRIKRNTVKNGVVPVSTWAPLSTTCQAGSPSKKSPRKPISARNVSRDM